MLVSTKSQSGTVVSEIDFIWSTEGGDYRCTSVTDVSTAEVHAYSDGSF